MQDRQNSTHSQHSSGGAQPLRRKKCASNGQNLARLILGVLLVVCLLFTVQIVAKITTGGKKTDTSPGLSWNKDPEPTDPSSTITKPTKPGETPAPTTPPEPVVVSTASIGATGDILMHGPVTFSGKQGDSFDYTNIFQYVEPYYEKFDFMVANLECSLGGTEAGEYKGYPTFNAPDNIADALKDAGIDMMLTSNNHAYDTGFNGFTRTLRVLQEKGLLTLGTQLEEDAIEYIVQDMNGIKVGMISYTYETGGNNPDRNYLNGIQLNAQATNMVTCFNYTKLDAFYSHLQTQLDAMEAEGAEAIIVFIHWGDEYSLKPNDNQKKIAQKLCDMGVDVIIGGHPHVVEPFDTLTSATGEKTYCIYSVGNALSNQTRDTLKNDTSNAIYTEDGMIFGVTFQKWSDGKVEVKEVEIIPTWVEKFNASTYNGVDYRIYPLDNSLETWSSFNAKKPSRLADSYNRTMSLVGEGLNDARQELNLDAVETSITEK